MENIKIIRVACVKANPEIVSGIKQTDIRDGNGEWIGIEEIGTMRPIRLADVLFSMRGEMEHVIDEQGHFLALSTSLEDGRMSYEGTGKYWNLRNDSLEAQSEETLQFLADLLKP